MTIENKIICFHCATLINAKEKVCSNCDTIVDKNRYERVNNKIHQYIQFGYTYRRRYEKQLKETGKIEEKYRLEFIGDVYAWIGLACLSGVIGSASWEFVKKIVGKIISQVDEPELEIFISDEKSLQRFSNYLLDYHRSFKGVNDDIQDVIFEEMEAHAAEGLSAYKTYDFDDKNQLLEYFKKVSNIARKKHKKSKISVKFAKELWKEIE